jgi:hypothetical protein
LGDRVSYFNTINFPANAKTAFGELLVGSLSPVIAVQFPYNLNELVVEKRENQSGTATQATSMAVMSSGAAANSSGCILTKERIKYEPGIGIVSRFTGIFTTGVANSEQEIGIGDSGEGFFFGYNGATFGLLHRYGGAPEVRTLTVSTASTTAENITITLDGDVNASVAVTNTGDTTLTANEIAAADYSDTGRGWDAHAVGDTVVFLSWKCAARTGTYTLSGATTAVGTFAQTVVGVASTDTWVAQASWNGVDKMDGNGASGVTLDPTKGNVFQIAYQYLGFGAVTFFIENPSDGSMVLVHTIQFANANTRPSLDNPSMPMYVCAENSTNTSDVTVKTASLSASVQGKRENQGVNRGVKATVVLSGTAAETPITSIRVKDVFQSKLNRTKVKLNFVSASVEHTKPVQVNFYVNGTLTGANWVDIDTDNSTMQQDTTATAVTGGVLLFTLDLGKTGDQTIDLTNDLYVGEFNHGDRLTITALPNSGNGAEADIGINFTEKL